MTTDEPEVVDGELVLYEPQPPATLWGSDPATAVLRMREAANALMDIVRSQGLAVKIRGHEHLTIEAWTTLGALKGVHAAIVWTRPNETGDGILARAESRTLEGALVGAAEAECSRVESRWKTAEPYAIRSMASTRALSRALQAPLRHIAVLAGYEGTSAEEMPADEPRAEPKPAPGPIPEDHRPSRGQVDEIKTLLGSLDKIDPGTDWRARCVEIAGAPWSHVTRTIAAELIRRLQLELTELMDESSS